MREVSCILYTRPAIFPVPKRHKITRRTDNVHPRRAVLFITVPSGMSALEMGCSRPNPQPDDPYVEKRRLLRIFNTWSLVPARFKILHNIVLYSSLRNRLNRGDHQSCYSRDMRRIIVLAAIRDCAFDEITLHSGERFKSENMDPLCTHYSSQQLDTVYHPTIR